MRKTLTCILLLGLLLSEAGLAETQLPIPSDYDAAYSTWNKRFAPDQEMYGYGMALFFYNLQSPSTVNPPQLLEFVDLSQGTIKHSILVFEKFTFEVLKDRGITISVSFDSTTESPDLSWAKSLMFSYVPSFKDVESMSKSFISGVQLSPRDTVYSHVPSKYIWLNYTITKQTESYKHRIDLISPL